jgi:hypothetical protein
MIHPTRVLIGITLTSAVLALTGPTVGPAGARPVEDDPGPAAARLNWRSCPLQRIGSQLVRCDSLTGAGVSAASWIPQQPPRKAHS